MISRSGRPLLRRNLIYSALDVSSIAERVSRTIDAIECNARVMAGRSKDHESERPLVGSHWRVTPNKRMARMPTQKLGAERPRAAVAITRPRSWTC